MLRTIIVVVLLALLPCLHPCTAQEVFCSPLCASGADPQKGCPDKPSLESIKEKVEGGDQRALLDAVNLDPSVAIPYLSRFVLDDTMNPERSGSALDALAKIPDHGNRIRQLVLEHPKDSMYKIWSFRVLTALKTKEAINALAYFLFNDDTPGYISEDVTMPSGKVMAARALGRMHLPDPPTDKIPEAYAEAEVRQWQDWWLAHKAQYEQ